MRTIFLFLYLLLGSIASAQDDDRQTVLGGSFNYFWQRQAYHFSSTLTNEVTVGHFNINPYLAFRLSPEWTIGLQSGIYLNSFPKGFDPFPDPFFYRDEFGFGVGLFARHYLLPDQRLQLFLEPGLLHFKRGYKSQGSDNFLNFEKIQHETSAYLTPGISWSVSKRFHLIARLGRLNFTWGKRKTFSDLDSPTFHYSDLQLNGRTLNLGAELRI